VVKTYFELFLAFERNLKATAAHIRQHGPDFPDFEDPAILRQVPAGHRLLKHTTWRKRAGRYYPTASTLPHLLSNPAYIGHFVYQRQVVKWHNHPPIVPEDLFFAAFATLSPTTLSGDPNPDYRSAQTRRTWPASATPDAPRPLCDGLIVSYGQTGWRLVGARWQRTRQRYLYAFRPHGHPPGWERQARHVDEALVRLLLARLEKTCALPSDALARGAAEPDGATLAAFEAWQATYQAHLRAWPTMDRAEQQQVLRDFVERIMATPRAQGLLELLVQWRDGSSTLVRLPRGFVSRHRLRRVYWLPSDVRRIAAFLERGATQLEIMAAFPERTWAAIWTMASRKLGQVPRVAPKPARNGETYLDYHRRVADGGGTDRAVGGLRWHSGDIARLTTLVEAGATKVELATAFPYRTWTGLRYEITRLFGPGRRISGFNTIRAHETIAQYRARLAPGDLPVAGPEPPAGRASRTSGRPFDVAALLARDRAPLASQA
jgi:hypothetical protein